MLDLAREVRARILIASTSEVYGDPIEHPQHESYWGNVNPIGPRACYDEGKRCAEALAVSYARQYSVEVRIVRIFNTYGPRMHENDGRVVSNFVVQALRGEPITVYGEGQQTRSFCYVVRPAGGFHAADGQRARRRSGQPRQPARDDRPRAGRDDQAPRQVEVGDHQGAAAQGRSRPAASPTSGAPRSCSTTGAPGSRWKRAWRPPSKTSGAGSGSPSQGRSERAWRGTFQHGAVDR